MNEYEKEIFQWLEDAGLNPVHHNMAVPHLEVSAKAFRKWVISEVLPSIRKQGGYMVARADER